MRLPTAILTLACVLAAGSAAHGQGFSLDCTSLQLGEPYTVEMSGGGPHAYYFLFVDAEAGPTSVPGVGLVPLGLSQQMWLAPVGVLDGSGATALTGTLWNDPASAGTLLHAAAMCHDAAAPAGYLLSNGVSRGVHPAHGTALGSTSLELGGNDTAVVDFPPSATFPFYGQSYTQVGVSNNGLITFGGTYIDPTESILDFVGGLPKVAVLWDDFSVSATSDVSVETGSDFVRVRWTEMPQYLANDRSTFEATLRADGTITLAWPRVEIHDGLVGVSPGGHTGTIVHVDWTAGHEGRAFGHHPVAEQFFPGFNHADLQEDHVTFLPEPGDYRWIR